MLNEEEDLKIVKNQNLNEEAEYDGSKKDLEQRLLDAQRYLNIFHQIHIFNDAKRAEFEQSLIDMPDKLRAVLLNLPGGRVLIEHIEDCEIKKGLRNSHTIFGNEDPITQTEKQIEKTTALNKEFTKTISDTIAKTLNEYNKNLLNMNEKILKNTKQLNQMANGGNGKDTSNQMKMIADVLRDNNQQQMEMVKTFGSTLSQAILMSQKEIFSSIAKAPVTNPVFSETIKKDTYTNQQPKTKNEPIRNNVTSMPEKPTNVTPLPSKDNKEIETRSEIKKIEPINIKTEQNAPKTEEAPKAAAPVAIVSEPVRTEVKNEQDTVKTIERKENTSSDADIANLLSADLNDKENKDNKADKDNKDNKADKENKDNKADKDNKDNKENHIGGKENEEKKENKVNNEDKGTPEKHEYKTSVFGSALQKIKNALTEPADDMSIDNMNITPISLNNGEDDLTASFSKAFTENKKENQPVSSAADEEEWEYVDEDGNPVDPSEWEYVDEDGNPVDPSEWEYVDENGNPIDPSEWEYVDENGNPIAK